MLHIEVLASDISWASSERPTMKDVVLVRREPGRTIDNCIATCLLACSDYKRYEDKIHSRREQSASHGTKHIPKLNLTMTNLVTSRRAINLSRKCLSRLALLSLIHQVSANVQQVIERVGAFSSLH